MRKFILTEIDGEWAIEQIEVSGIWPTVSKKTDREVVARLMQVLGVGPVAPQTEPERIEVGSDSIDGVPC